jgi:hypothetical protein
MTLKVAYFQPTIMAMDQIPPVEFSRIFTLTEEFHSHPDLHDKDNPLLSIRGGQQIQVYPNKHNIDVKWLVSYIETVCQGYMDLATSQSGVDDLKMCKPQVVNIWTIRQQAGEYQEMHSHPGGNLSGIMYVTVPEFAEDGNASDGQSAFKLPFSKDVSKFILNDTWKHSPQAGNIVLFPSHIPHTVYPWRGEGYRTIVAFNAILRPRDEYFPQGYKNG